MCGRYVVTNPVNKTKKIVKTSIKVENDVNYNAHPSQELPIIKKYSNGLTLEKAKWGIIPSWAKKKDFKALINARLETINEKVSFKNLIKKTRCVSVMDGFYEWKREGTIKTPHYFTRDDKATMYVAGIFSNDEFCLITEEAQDNIKQIHHRQPVSLHEQDIEKWLKKDGNPYNFVGYDKQGLIGLEFGVFGLPETFLINKKGKIIYKHLGPLDKKIIENDIYPLLN